jgi:predicted nucleotidyltransferase component of viral defense system
MATIIQARLQKYLTQTTEEETHALKEILQEIILYGLSEAGFFKEAVFQGGTSLRVLYNLNRFSEGLDFILKKPNADFQWQHYFSVLEETCKQYGIVPEIIDKTKADSSVQKMFLKDNSIVKFLNLSFYKHPEQKLTIKLEIDTNPPKGSQTEIKFLDFPLPFELINQDLSSNFAGKSHALLCRKYVKGRDWYDFLWYVTREVPVNFIFLENTLHQQGPWAGQKIKITPYWFLKALENKVRTIDWKKAAAEVSPFLNERDRKALTLWSNPFFMDRIEKLKSYLDKQ